MGGAGRPSALGKLAAVAAVAALAALTGFAVRAGSSGTADADVTVDTLANGAVRVHSGDVAHWGGGAPWRLVEDLRLGSVEAEGPELFSAIQFFDVDDEGRMYVLDRASREVRVFGRDGAFVRAFGGKGEGPGELSRPAGLFLDPQGRVWVVDPGNARYTVWDRDGRLLSVTRRFVDGQIYPWPGTVTRDGHVLEGDTRFVDGKLEVVYVLFGPDGEAVDTVPVPAFDPPRFVVNTESGSASYGVPFAPALRLSFRPDGTYWSALTDEYRLVRHDLRTGDTLQVVEKEATPAPVRREEVDVALERYARVEEQGGRLDRSLVPDRHPLIGGFVDDRAGYLWVARNTPPPADPTAETLFEPRPPTFDVFDGEGIYLGPVKSPVALRSPVVTDRHVYGATRDSLGVEYLVRLRIEGRGP